MLLFGRVYLKKHLYQLLAPNRAEIRKLFKRMTTPQVKTTANVVTNKTPVNVNAGETKKEHRPLGDPVGDSGKTLLLVPDELNENELVSNLVGHIKKRQGDNEQVNILFYGGLTVSDEDTANEVKLRVDKAGVDTIMLVQEAWQPPIEEVLNLLRTIRKQIAADREISIGLIGRQAADNAFIPVDKEQWDIWKMKIDLRNDPYLALTRLSS